MFRSAANFHCTHIYSDQFDTGTGMSTDCRRWQTVRELGVPEVYAPVLKRRLFGLEIQTKCILDVDFRVD